MMKQKIRTLALMTLPFGTSVSFMRSFRKDGASVAADSFLAFGIILVLIAAFLPKTRKTVLETAEKLQPLAAVVFTATFVLSFLPYSIIWPQLFSVLVLSAVCLCMAFEKGAVFNHKLFFGMLCGGALIGTGFAFSGHVGFVYVCFVLLSLCCRRETGEKTVRDVWKDIAFPLFVLFGAFILFIAANHGEMLPAIVAQSVVMLMTGGLLMMPSSALRLALMTVVMMIFGSYVFSAQNPASVFNRSGTPPLQMERLF